jgi:cell division protein FtsN
MVDGLITMMGAMEARLGQASNVPPAVPPPQPTWSPNMTAIPPTSPPLFDGPPVDGVHVIPGMPSPNTNMVYRLQVGTFSAVEGASRGLRQLQAAGFDVAQEWIDNKYRVLAVGIQARDVRNAVQRLGAIGFKQIWIRE